VVGNWLARWANSSSSAPPVVRAKPPLYVDPQGGEAGTFKTLQEAINKAVANDHIVIKHHIAENVEIIDRPNLVGLVIEGNKELDNITWTPRLVAGKPMNKLLTLGNCPDCKIRNLHFDGRGAEVLIGIFGKCPGLTLESLRLDNFTQAGVQITNAEGADGKPITLSGLEFGRLTNPAARAISFTINPTVKPEDNRWFKITGCAFEGDTNRVVYQKGKPVKDAEWQKGVPPEEK